MKYELNLLSIVKVLLKKKIVILINFIVISIVALVFALNMDLWYKSTVTFIPKGSGGGAGLFAMIGEQMSADLVGDLPFSKRQYLTILGTMELRDDLIDKFDLINHYEMEGKNLRHFARKILKDRIVVEVEEEGGLGITDVLSIKISAIDKDRQVAADMANYIYDWMENKALELHQESYNKLEIYLSDQLSSYDDSLRVAQKKLSDFMKEYRVYSIDKQKEMVLEAYGRQKAEIIALDTRIAVIQKEYSASNPKVKTLKKQRNALAANLKKMETTKDNDVFVGLENSINLSETFSELYVDVEVYSKLKQILLQQVKQANIKGDRNFSGVYLLERATPALYKYKPKRALVIVAIVFVYMSILLSKILVTGVITQNPRIMENIRNNITDLD